MEPRHDKGKGMGWALTVSAIISRMPSSPNVLQSSQFPLDIPSRAFTLGETGIEGRWGDTLGAMSLAEEN